MPATIAPMAQEIRAAASMIVARGEAGREPLVLVLRRSEASRFLPGYVVFPGGAVESDDAGLAARLFGTAGEGSRAAGVRELAEEAGLALTASGVRPATADDPLAPALAAPPLVGQLPQIAHWVAPPEVPVRFDARYFAVASGAVEPTVDGREATAAWWAAPGELLAAWEAGEQKLYWPTYYTLTALARCRDVAAILGLRMSTREPADAELRALPSSVFGGA